MEIKEENIREVKNKLYRLKGRGLTIFNLLLIGFNILLIVSAFTLIWGESDLAFKLFLTAALSNLIVLASKWVFLEGVKKVDLQLNPPPFKAAPPKNISKFRERLDDAMKEAHEKNKNINP